MGIFLSNRPGWRILLGLTSVPSIIQCIILPFCVETPSWLSSHGLIYDAREALRIIRGREFDIEDELSDILSATGMRHSSTQETAHDESPEALESGSDMLAASPTLSSPPTASLLSNIMEKKKPSLTVYQLFQNPTLRRRLMAAFMLQIAQQWSGINAAIYYSTTIFSQSYSPETAIKLTLLVSFVNLFTTLLSSSLIERVGRRYLLLTAEGGMAVSAFIIAAAVRLGLGSSIVVAALMFFVGSFGIGLGSIPWYVNLF